MRVETLLDDERAFAAGCAVVLCQGKQESDREIEFSQVQHGRRIVKLKGLDLIDDVEKLVGAELKVLESALPALDNGQFYTFQLRGCTIATDGGEELGTVVDVWEGSGTPILEVQDADHTNKLKKVAEAIDLNNTKKLQAVVKRYSQALTEQASNFRDGLVDNLSKYLDLYLEKALPTKELNEAVKDKKARIVLENLRRTLAVDSALMAESIQEAVYDGANTIAQANATNEQLTEQVSTLTEQLEEVKAQLVLEQKLSTVTADKRSYVKRVLQGKRRSIYYRKL